MKKKIAILMFSVLSSGSLLTSCADYLDSDKYFEDRTTLQQVFEDKTRTEEWLAYAYSFLRNENAEVASKGFATIPAVFADDMYFGDRDYESFHDTKDLGALNYNKFKLGEYNENDYNASWGTCYKGIRQASIFIQNVDKNKEMSSIDKLDYKGQARFIRAYYYWLLLKKYGPIPIMPDAGVDYTKNYDEVATPRSTYEECADFISTEMIQAAKEIQYLKRDMENVSRPTKGACLATRALVLLYAASPLMNGNTDDFAKKLVDDKGKQLLNSDYSEEKWAKAAAACKDVMDLGVYDLYHVPFNTTNAPGFPVTMAPPADGNFSEKSWPYGWSDIDPYASYRNLFDGDVAAVDNPELIFSRVNNVTSDMNSGIEALVIHEMPIDLGGWNTHGMTQKMVDAYYMKNGDNCPGKDKEIGRGDGSERLTGFTSRADIAAGKYKPLAVGVSLQYADREPRFYASVAYNGSTWEALGDPDASRRNRQVFYYRGSGNGYINAFSYLRTGIGVKKWYNPNDYTTTHSYDNIKRKPETAIRYADILLAYAEALNELDGTYQIASWYGSKTYTISRDINEIKKGTNPVRIRAGLPDYSDADYASKDLLRSRIKRERMIEFMGEGRRYYDLRRWKDAPAEESLQIYGCNVMMTAANREQFQQVVPIYNLPSTFSDKMYFWPISHAELKHNSRLTQNPGWTLND